RQAGQTGPSSTTTKFSQTFRLRPIPPKVRKPIQTKTVGNDVFDESESGEEMPVNRFGKVKSKGIKKVYIIVGAVAVALVIGIIIIVIQMSKQAKQKEKDDLEVKLKKIWLLLDETERDYQLEPQKVLDEINKQMSILKGTSYEEKALDMEKTAQEREKILDKIKQLDASPPTTVEDFDKKTSEYNKLLSLPALNDDIKKKIKGNVAILKKAKEKKIAEDTRKAEQRQAEQKKLYDDFMKKVETLKKEKKHKELLKDCDNVLAKLDDPKQQEEINRIKNEAKEAIEEEQAEKEREKGWQTLSDDATKWERTGDGKTEVYVDTEDRLTLKNPNPKGTQAWTSLINNNKKRGWKDFTLEVEFKVEKGSFDMFLRGAVRPVKLPAEYGGGTINVFTGIPVPFPKKFGGKWQKYTMELRGKKLTISGTDMEPTTTDVVEGAGAMGINIKPADEIILKELKIKIIQ
ncbi:MAG: hypothetical protein QME51_01900, partial [Planctomycetota bacterium]|nr:hypothetical protein [Planctomycetota bacterium]